MLTYCFAVANCTTSKQTAAQADCKIPLPKSSVRVVVVFCEPRLLQHQIKQLTTLKSSYINKKQQTLKQNVKEKNKKEERKEMKNYFIFP
jgi:hypothetical protein